jgi:hypothetical protein
MRELAHIQAASGEADPEVRAEWDLALNRPNA